MKRFILISLVLLLSFFNINALSALGDETPSPEIIKTEENVGNTEDNAEESQVPEQGVPLEDNTEEGETEQEDQQGSEDLEKEDDQINSDDYKIEYDNNIDEPWG